MSYAGYLAAAYAVFALVLLADWLAGHLAVRRELRQARRAAAPRRPAPVPPPAGELER